MRNNEIDQFIFNGVTLHDYVRANPTRSLMPSVTHSTAQMMDREVHLRTNIDPQDIEVRLDLRTHLRDPRALALLRRKLRGAFYTKEPKPLILPDDPEVYYMASVVDASDLDNLWATGSCTITFRAFDPIAHGESKSEPVKAGTNSIVIDGTYETWPMFKLKATGNGVKVEHAESGYWVQLSSTTASGATVVIGMDGEGTVTVNANNAAIVLGSTFFPLQPGNNTIKLTNASGTIEWEERWV